MPRASNDRGIMEPRPRLGAFSRGPAARQKLQGIVDGLRHVCRGTASLQCGRGSADAMGECAKSAKLTDAGCIPAEQLDGWAAMLQAISIGKEFPMLEP